MILLCNPLADAFSSDTIVELATQDSCPLTTLAHLILEVSVNERVISHVNLSCRESSFGVWEADKTIAM
jgi:hypothetical protein